MAGKMGRPPLGDAARSEIVSVRFTGADLAALDAARGETKRSTFVRDAARRQIRGEK